MKMKLFSAATEAEAMAQMRNELGEDAVILGAYETETGFEVRAAIERQFNHRFTAPRAAEPRPAVFETLRVAPMDQSRSELSRLLSWAGAADGFGDIVAAAGARLTLGGDMRSALSAGLEGVLTFRPLEPALEHSIMLVGAPGAGRTSIAACLARAAGPDAVEPVSADFEGAGAIYRLAGLMQRPYVTAALSEEALVRIVKERQNTGRRLVIDGPPVNPCLPGDYRRIASLIAQLDVEPVLVVAADTAPLEIEDNARRFSQIGVKRAIVTRLDAVRRRAGVFSALSSARLSIAQLRLTTNGPESMIPATAMGVANLLLEAAPDVELLKGAA